MSAQRDPNRRALHSHYVSNANGVIYAAQTGLPGIEDESPIDWRPATHEEIERYKQGRTRATPSVGGTVDLRGTEVASPTSLTLQEDDPAVDPEPGYPLQAPQDPPPAPPAAFAGAPVPAFKLPVE